MTLIPSTLLEQGGASVCSLMSCSVKKCNFSATPVGFSIVFFDSLAQFSPKYDPSDGSSLPNSFPSPQPIPAASFPSTRRHEQEVGWWLNSRFCQPVTCSLPPSFPLSTAPSSTHD